MISSIYNRLVLRSFGLAAILITLLSPPVFADKGTVLVFPFENQSEDRNLDWIGQGISELIIERLRSEPELYVFDRDERLAGFEKLGIPDTAVISRATSMKLGWDNGADRVIVGRFAGTAANFSVYARIIDLAAAGASQEIKASGKLDDIIPLTNALSWQLLKIIVPATQTPESDYTSRPPVPRSAFENYVRGILSTDPQRRSEFLETAIRLQPQYPAAVFELGRLKSFQADWKASKQQLEKIGSLDPYYLRARFAVALNDYQLGDYARAAASLSELPETYDVLVNLGAAQLEKGDSGAALAAWKRALAIDPFLTEAVFNIGYANFLKGDLDAAAKSLEQSLRLQGRDWEAMFLLSRVYDRLGRVEDSQRLQSQATRQSPRVERWLTQPLPKLERLCLSPDLAALRGIDFTGLWSPARVARREKGQDLLSWVESIQTQIDSQLYGDALRQLRETLLVFPDSADAHLLTAQVYEKQKNFDDAVKEYQKSIGIRPSAESYVMMARLYRTMNQTQLALRAVEQALKLDPDHAAALALKAELQKPPGKRLDP